MSGDHTWLTGPSQQWGRAQSPAVTGCARRGIAPCHAQGALCAVAFPTSIPKEGLLGWQGRVQRRGSSRGACDWLHSHLCFVSVHST